MNTLKFASDHTIRAIPIAFYDDKDVREKAHILDPNLNAASLARVAGSDTHKITFGIAGQKMVEMQKLPLRNPLLGTHQAQQFRLSRWLAATNTKAQTPTPLPYITTSPTHSTAS